MINIINFYNHKKFKGQAVIVVLLIMVVALTVGLSISTQSIRDVKIATRTEESQRAFSAAEAGLEVALQSGASVSEKGGLGGSSGGDVRYAVTVTDEGGGDYFIFPEQIAKDETQQIWLVSHDETGNFTSPYYNTSSIGIYWGNAGTSSNSDTLTPALEASVIYLEGGTYKIKKYAYDPFTLRTNRSGGNNFSANVGTAGYTIGGKVFQFKINGDLTLPSLSRDSSNGLIALRLRLLYADKHFLGVLKTGSDNIPVQGKLYDSTGKVVQGALDQSAETRRILFFKSYPYLPGIFDYALYSGSSLSKPAP